MTLGNIAFGPSTFKDFDRLFVGFDDTYNRLAKMHDDFYRQTQDTNTSTSTATARLTPKFKS